MLVIQAWTHLETLFTIILRCVSFLVSGATDIRWLPIQSTAAHIDGYLYSLLQHKCRWLLVQSAAVQKLFLPYRMKPSEYLYLHLQFNLQLTRIFCKFLILMLLNLLRRICCCFLVTSCPLVCFTKPALVISSSLHFVH